MSKEQIARNGSLKMADRVGQQIGSYRLLRLLGTGGFSEVYLAEHVQNNEQYAVKVFNAQINAQINNTAQSSIYTEARTLSRLLHPNIVRIVDFGIDFDKSGYQNGSPYLVMPYASSGTLRDRHPKGTQVPLHQIVGYVSQLADALQYAHEQNVIHRDVKPENMLIATENQIILSDFGIASVYTAWFVTPVTIPGTLAYTAPESLEGKFSPASDQYSLGIVVYEWLSGLQPFTGSPSQTMFGTVSAPPPPLAERFPHVSKGIEQVVMKALSKNPEGRYSTVKEFASALEREERTTTMLPSSVPNPEEKRTAVSSPTTHVASPFDITATNLQDVYREIQVLPSKEQKEILIKTFGSLSIKDKNEIVQEMGISPLSQEATDFVWKVVVSGAVTVFVGSAVGIAVAVFVGASVAPLITVFTAAIAFLGGLLAPSPVQNTIRSLASSFKSSSKAGGE